MASQDAAKHIEGVVGCAEADSLPGSVGMQLPDEALLAVPEGDIDQADGFAASVAVRAGQTSDADAVLAAKPLGSTAGHSLSDRGRYHSFSGNQFCGHTQQVLLGLLGIGHDAAGGKRRCCRVDR